MIFRPESSKRGHHSFTSMSGGSDLVLKSQSYQKCNIKHQLKSDSPCCTSFDILPPGRSMKAISGVLESPWAALSTRRIISLIGGDFWQIEWVKKVVTLCRARPISPPHQNCTPSVHFWPNWRYNNHSKALFKLYRLVSLLTQQIMMIVTTKISKSDLPP